MRKKVAFASLLLLFAALCFADDEPPLSFEEDGVIWTRLSEDEINPRETVFRPDYIPLSIPGAEHAAVEKYRRRYLSARNREWLKNVVAAGNMYRPYIQMQLKARGMPDCLEFLPIVE